MTAASRDPAPGGKRLLDIAIALPLLLVASPVLTVLVLAIRLDSTGPGLFRQMRVGRDERAFTCLKLRTMRADTGDRATHLTSADQVTRIGGFLRRTKLDELPQLWNVLKGEMSLVGPRPCLPSQDELIVARRRRGVFLVRPGITGLAQVRGIDMSDPARLVELDARYVETMTMAGDLGILAQTLIGKGQGDRTA
ncbi:sugar transferase [Aliihoeflea sp. 2WW]|uniref:sugar transferase n=1 Tax=Aliihoeflea sp. 2WW TaxID=1381123 RepID=UPI00046431D9|nr:sugar transferase [Aliihoeflea sp. 2WW]